jgi:two-component system sensor histidine kinase YesM
MNFIKGSFKRQIFFIFLAVMVVMVVTGGILTIQGFQARVRMDHENVDLEQDVLINEALSATFEEAKEVLSKLKDNETIIKSLNSNMRGDMAVYLALYDAAGSLREYATIDLYKGSECWYSTKRGGLSAFLPENFSLLSRAFNEPAVPIYGFDPGSEKSNGSELLTAMCIDGSSGPVYAIVRFDEAGIKKRLEGLLNARDGFILADSMIRPYVLLGTAADGMIGERIRENLFNGDLYNKDIESNVYMSEVSDTGLLSIYITEPAFERSAVTSGYHIVLMQVVISVIVCLIVANGLSVLFAKPINTLNSAMKRFRKGDFDTKIEMEREDELGTLATGFNKMTGQLKNTMEEMVAAERKVNEARIEMMQAQLNPHFLYNTLDTIKWVAKANQVPEIATLSTGLASILRTGISSEKFCPLSKELQLVKNYCDIQKIRFDDSFDLFVDVPAALEDVLVQKLILQPIIENAIIHGLEGRTDGKISIKAFSEQKEGFDHPILHITIEDNGKGIDPEMIKALGSRDPEALSGHLGLKNINTIISLYYGEKYGVNAERPEAGGTVMHVLLPEIRDKNPEDDNG